MGQPRSLLWPLFTEDEAEDKYLDTTGNRDEGNPQGTSEECAPGNFSGEERVKFVSLFGLSGKQ